MTQQWLLPGVFGCVCVCVCCLNLHTGVQRRAGPAGLSVGVLRAGAAAFRLGHRAEQGPHALAALIAAVAGAAHVSVCFGQEQGGGLM